MTEQHEITYPVTFSGKVDVLIRPMKGLVALMISDDVAWCLHNTEDMKMMPNEDWENAERQALDTLEGGVGLVEDIELEIMVLAQTLDHNFIDSIIIFDKTIYPTEQTQNLFDSLQELVDESENDRQEAMRDSLRDLI